MKKYNITLPLRKAKIDEAFVMKLIAEYLGGTCEISSAYEDKFLHIDIWWNSPKGGRIAIDVKGIKNPIGCKDGKSDDTQWIEIKNNYGYDGWIYGKNNYIAFRTFTTVIFVKTEKLRELTDYYNVKAQPITYSTKENKSPYVPFYMPYCRYGKDEMTYKVPTTHLVKMAHFIIEF